MFLAHVQKRLWERSMLNVRILRHRLWAPGAMVDGSNGRWASVFKSSNEVCSLVSQRMESDFAERFPTADAAICSRNLNEFQACRMKDDNLKDLFSKTMVWVNWVMVGLQAEYPNLMTNPTHAAKLDTVFSSKLADADLMLIVNARTADAAYTTTSFKDLDAIWKPVQAMMDVREREDITRTVASVNQKKWDMIVEQVKSDEESFKLACASSRSYHSKSNLWMLSKAREVAQMGKDATDQHEQNSLCVKEIDGMNSVGLEFTSFTTAFAGGVGLQQPPGRVVIWNMSTLGKLLSSETIVDQHINAMKDLLHKEPDNSVGIILHASNVSNQSRAVFHGKVAEKLVKAKLDCDIDLNLQYKRRSDANHQSLGRTGWIVFTTGHTDSNNVFAGAKLVIDGTIGDLVQLSSGDMEIVTDLSDALTTTAGSCSIQTRARYCSEGTYHEILQRILQGANLPVSRHNKKAAAIAILSPFNGSALKAVLQLQTMGAKADTGNDMDIDVRAMAFEVDAVAFSFCSSMLRTAIYSEWFNETLHVPGFKKDKIIECPDIKPSPPTLSVLGMDSKNRLVLPRGVIDPHLQENTATSTTVALFVNEFNKKWQADDAMIYVAIMERSSTATANMSASIPDAEAPSTREVTYPGQAPTSQSEVQSVGILVECPTKCQKMNLYVLKNGTAWFSAATDVGVLRNQKVAGFGSGGLRTLAEAAQAKEKGSVVLPFALSSDTIELLVTLPNETEATMSLHEALAKLTLKGHTDVYLPLHKIQRLERTPASTRDTCPIHIHL